MQNMIIYFAVNDNDSLIIIKKLRMFNQSIGRQTTHSFRMNKQAHMKCMELMRERGTRERKRERAKSEEKKKSQLICN